MSLLSEISPAEKERVIDLVQKAGVDVSDWANFSGGKARAAMNPKYCYEWSFVEPGKVVILNLWFDDMKEKKGQVFQDLNTRKWGGSPNGQSLAVRVARAKKIDNAIHTAYSDQLPVRVIVCDGTRRDINDPNAPSSQVRRRKLDPVAWAVTSYNLKTGRATVTRGAKPPRYVDQFVVLAARGPQKKLAEVDIFVRDPMVRERVRSRAGGRCEYCKQPGFQMSNGAIYIETHHVIPLSEDGPDTDQNVVALCANHHRQAHHGQNASEMRVALQKYLAEVYSKK